MSHPPPANDFDGLLSDDEEEEVAAPAPAAPADAAFAACLQSQLAPAGTAAAPHPPPLGMLPQQAAWLQVRKEKRAQTREGAL